VKAALVCLL